jgi:hypothetical protein
MEGNTGPPPVDEGRVTATGLTINLRHPNWRDTVTYTFAGGERGGDSAILSFRATASAGESYSMQVYDWSAATYNTRATVSAGPSDYTYEMNTATEIDNDGTMRVRWVDASQSADETQGTLTLDYSGIVQTQETIGGGTPSPLKPECTYDWLWQTVRCLDVSAWLPAADILRVCFAIDDLPEKCTAKGGAVTIGGINPWYGILLTGHVVHMKAVYGNGAELKGDWTLRTDDFPRIFLWMGALALAGFSMYEYRRRKLRRRTRTDPFSGGSR